jgi:hypothetical protein
MMKENREQLGIGVGEAFFDRTIQRTDQRLKHEAAEITIERIQERSGLLEIEVHVQNKTGHKFPTGFPSRRAWLHLSVADAQGVVIFESGNYNEQGEIVSLKSPFEPHHDRIDSAGQVLIYQAVMGDVSGKQTDTLLRAATYLKDNRLPPRGYLQSGKMASYTGIKGKAVEDDNFNGGEKREGSGADSVTYFIEAVDAHYPLTIRGRLLYQSSNPRFLANLFEDDLPAVERFEQFYAESPNTPVVVDSTTYDLPAP